MKTLFEQVLTLLDTNDVAASTVLTSLDELGRVIRGASSTQNEASLTAKQSDTLKRSLDSMTAWADQLTEATDLLLDGLLDVANDPNAVVDESELVSALLLRDRIELILLAAETLVRSIPQLDDALTAALLSFDELVRPHVWRLTRLNQIRSAHSALVTTSYQDRFWWWCEGLAIPEQAVAALEAVAILVARYPQARARLDALVSAEKVQLAASSSVETVASGAVVEAQVLPFGQWALRLRGLGNASVANDAVAMAAAPPTDETFLFGNHWIELSMKGQNELLIDLLEPGLGEPPTLVHSNGALVCQPVAGALDRFVISLSQTLLDGSFELIASLVSGPRKLRLPPA